MESPRVGYLIPEFPGQTHVWIWREIEQLRRWGLPLQIFATRRPPARDRARHGFADAAEKETSYLWPLGAWTAGRAVVWALLAHPVGFVRCLHLALKLPVEGRFRRPRLLALVPAASELARLCTRRRIDRLHSHSCANSAILCMMTRRLVGIPYSMTLNANIDWWGGAMLEKFREAEFTISITEWLLEQMRREFPTLGPRQTVLARIGVDVDLWKLNGPRRIEDGLVRVISVARLHRTKAHDVLLEAVQQLRDELTLAVIIIGDGPERATLEAQSKRLGLSDVVEFLGSRGQEQIIEQMVKSDIFALVSRFEPLGVVYMEAMAMELATIGTTAGGVREIIDEGIDGVLVPPEDPSALAEAIRKLARDVDLRRRMGHAGRHKVTSRFDSRLGAAVLYERFVGAQPPRGGADRIPARMDLPAARSMEPST